jgi:hypothetical protein
MVVPEESRHIEISNILKSLGSVLWNQLDVPWLGGRLRFFSADLGLFAGRLPCAGHKAEREFLKK